MFFFMGTGCYSSFVYFFLQIFLFYVTYKTFFFRCPRYFSAILIIFYRIRASQKIFPHSRRRFTQPIKPLEFSFLEKLSKTIFENHNTPPLLRTVGFLDETFFGAKSQISSKTDKNLAVKFFSVIQDVPISLDYFQFEFKTNFGYTVFVKSRSWDVRFADLH